MVPRRTPDSPGEPTITLYRHVACPYCERVVRVCDEHSIPYVSRFVVPRHSDRDVVKRVSGRRTVPLLVDHETDVVMAESENIIRYLKRTYVGIEDPDVSSPVVSLPETTPVAVGETAPDFTRPLVTAEYWEATSLSDLTAESTVLLVFYPPNGTGLAQRTWIRIRDRGWGGGDLRVVGLSPSSPYSHRSFIVERDMTYALFSDPSGEVADEYNLGHEYDGMPGVRGPRPAFYLLERDRTVRFRWVAETWPAVPDYDELETELASV